MSDTHERTSLHVDIEHLDGSATIRLAGVLDAAPAPTVRDEMWPLLARYEADMVTIDATALESVDDVGMGVLVAFARAMAPGRPRVRGARSELRSDFADAGCFELD